MDENKIKALIQLLDDEDKEVYQQVHKELLKLGKSYFDFLRNQYFQQENELLKLRIGYILQELQGEVVIDKLLNWRKNGGESLLEGWILVSQYFFPTLNVLEYKKKINTWVHQIWLKTQPGMKILQKLKVVLQFLKNNLGFSFMPSEDLYLNADFLFIHHVIDQKKGNTLSLSILLNIIFNQLEVYTHIISLREYYAIRYLDHQHHYYIDVFNVDEIFTENDVKLFLIKLNLDINLLHYKPISNIYLILFLLNYAKEMFTQSQNLEQLYKTEELLNQIDIKFK